MKLSILISAYLRPHLLTHNLFSITKHKIDCEYEIIVINDGIEDETEVVCKQYSSTLPIKYIFSGQRNTNGFRWRGPCVAYNIAAKVASGEHLILASAEMYVLTNAIQDIHNALLNNPNKRVSTKDNYYDGGDILRDVQANNGNVTNMQIVLRTEKLRTDIPFFMSIPRSAYLDIGGYDEDFCDGISFDDDDIMHRLDLYGIEPMLIEGSVIHLNHSDASHGHRMNPEQWEIAYNKNKALIEERRGIIKRNTNKEWGVL